MTTSLDCIMEVPYLIEMWEERVKVDPHKLMLVDAMSGETFTRGQVERLSGCVFSYLKTRHIGREDFVMICMPRDIRAIVCILGVWKAGAAFTIVENDYAPDRIEYIKNDTACREFIDINKWEEIQKYDYLEGFEEADDHAAAFAIYTSGTTGFPKGVLHEYGNIKLNSLLEKENSIKRSYEAINMSLVSPLNFVASIKIIANLFEYGFVLHLMPYDIVKNPVRLKQYFIEQKISFTFLSPSIIRILGDDLGPYMKHVLTGSESANGIFLEGAELVNTYTMSEGFVTVTQFVIDKPYDTVPIGCPCFDKFHLMLLDEEGNEVPEGEMGEIAFSNPFMRGYINLSEETARVLKNGIYHTGDLGKKLPDGNLILCGRANEMIKINGNRIEPAEIEKAFKELTGALWCCVKGFEEPEKSFICLYYKEELNFNENKLRDDMSASLPYYMLPSRFVRIEEIPLLPNGKINKMLLPYPEEVEPSVKYVAPRDELEQLLCQCVEKVLKIERIGIRDDFYQLGMNSLSAMSILSEAKLDDINASDIFRAGTIEKLSQIYRKKSATVSELSPIEYELRARKMQHTPLMLQVFFKDSQCCSSLQPNFNISLSYVFEDKNKAEAIAKALNRVVEQSPVFSTVFDYDGERNLVEYVKKDVCKRIEVENVSETEFECLSRKFFSNFERILKVPLYRFGVYVTEKRGYLLLHFHHMLIDGMGVKLFMQRLEEAYNGEELPMDTFYSLLAKNEEFMLEEEHEEFKKQMDKEYGHVNWSRNFDADRNEGENEVGVINIPFAISHEMMEGFEKRTGITGEELFKVGILLAMARANKRKDVIMSSTFHNRTEPVTKSALGTTFKMIPTAFEFEKYVNMEEVFEASREKSMFAIKYSQYDWTVRNERLFESDFMRMSYVTKEITDGIMKRNMGLQYITRYNEGAHACAKTLIGIYETDMGIIGTFSYSKRFYSDQKAKECSDTLGSIIMQLISIENMKELSVNELIEA